MTVLDSKIADVLSQIDNTASNLDIPKPGFLDKAFPLVAQALINNSNAKLQASGLPAQKFDLSQLQSAAGSRSSVNNAINTELAIRQLRLKANQAKLAGLLNIIRTQQSGKESNARIGQSNTASAANIARTQSILNADERANALFPNQQRKLKTEIQAEHDKNARANALFPNQQRKLKTEIQAEHDKNARANILFSDQQRTAAAKRKSAEAQAERDAAVNKIAQSLFEAGNIEPAINLLAGRNVKQNKKETTDDVLFRDNARARALGEAFDKGQVKPGTPEFEELTALRAEAQNGHPLTKDINLKTISFISSLKRANANPDGTLSTKQLIQLKDFVRRNYGPIFEAIKDRTVSDNSGKKVSGKTLIENESLVFLAQKLGTDVNSLENDLLVSTAVQKKRNNDVQKALASGNFRQASILASKTVEELIQDKLLKERKKRTENRARKQRRNERKQTQSVFGSFGRARP